MDGDIASIRDFGAAGDGVTDDTAAIQSALDSGVGTLIIPEGVFGISDAIRPHSDQSIEIRGTLKMADANVQAVTSDVQPGDSFVELADASGFRCGQWVLLCDDESTGWNPGETRSRGDCGRVVRIDGNRLEFEGRFNLGCRVVANARAGTHSSVILIEDESNIHIYGSGTIDGNRIGRMDMRPMVMKGCGVRADLSIGGDGGEELRAGCGIVSSGLPGNLRNITIEGITVRDSSEHNICLVGAVESRILNTVCSGANDKNITLLDSLDCRIEGNIAAESEHEDGIMLHQKTGNRRISIRSNLCFGNPRHGIHAGAGENEIHLARNLCVDNGANMTLGGADSSSSGDTCLGQNGKRFPRPTRPQGVSFSGRNTKVVDLTVSGNRLVNVEITGQNIEWTGGVVRGSGGAGDDCGISLEARGDAGSTCGILIREVKIEGCHTGIRIGQGVQNIELDDNSFALNDDDLQDER